MATLEAHDDVGLFGQPIDDLALAFIPPLGADHDNICHTGLVQETCERSTLRGDWRLPLTRIMDDPRRSKAERRPSCLENSYNYLILHRIYRAKRKSMYKPRRVLVDYPTTS